MADDDDIPRRWHRRMLASFVLLIVGLTLVFAGLSLAHSRYENLWVLGVGFAVVLAGAAFRRCPKCGKGLDRVLIPRYCPHCGVKLMH